LPSAVAGDVALVLDLRGPVVVAAAAPRTRGGVPPEAIAMAAQAADLLVALTVGPGARVLAVALPADGGCSSGSPGHRGTLPRRRTRGRA
jgi:hypothetical protein